MALIFIVDGQRSFRDYLASLLISRQLRVMQASDGAAALEMVEKHRPDLLICDVLLRVTDGYELLDEMRRHKATPCPPVIFCVSSGFEKEARLAATDCGVHYVIAKTTDPHNILETVYASLGNVLAVGVKPRTASGRLRAPPPMNPIDANATVYLVDDDPAMLRLLSEMMLWSGLKVETFESAEDFLERYLDEPGCLLTDLQMTGMSGIEMLTTLRARQKHIPTIIMTGLGELDDAKLAMKLDVLDFLDKSVSRRTLIARVYAALQEDADRRCAFNQAKRYQCRLSSLTARELELAELLIEGKASKEIAVGLNISIKTVGIHRTHLMAKTGALNVADLVRIMMIARGA